MKGISVINSFKDKCFFVLVNFIKNVFFYLIYLVLNKDCVWLFSLKMEDNCYFVRFNLIEI